VFTLKGCLPIVGAQVISSETEEEMLLKWRSFLHACDADILTGYNVQVRRQLTWYSWLSMYTMVNH
jgi:DNA polymerase delta subunit 1